MNNATENITQNAMEATLHLLEAIQKTFPKCDLGMVLKPDPLGSLRKKLFKRTEWVRMSVR